jgi:pilus assembly protein TadC
MFFLLSRQQVQTEITGGLFVRLLGGILGVVGAVAALVIWLGMTLFCLREDTSPLRRRVFWIVIFLLVGFLGPIVYFFRVYRIQVKRIVAAPV